MKSLMEPIYEYLYDVYSGLSTDPEIAFNAQLNDSSLSLLIQRAIWLRDTQGVESAHGYLHNPNRKFLASLDRTVLFQYYYLLAVIHFERYDVSQLEEAIRQSNMLLERDQLDRAWFSRFSLLQVFYGTIVEGPDVLENASEWWDRSANKRRLQKLGFSLSVYFGSWALHKEIYTAAQEWLSKSSALAKTKMEKAIAYSNLGALAYFQDEFEEAIKCYKNALWELENTKTRSHDMEKIRLMLFENLRNMEIREAARRNDFIYPEQIRLQENDLEYAQRMRNIATHYITDEVFDENLQSRHGFRVSNNFYAANRYFNIAERSYQLLGNIQGKQSILHEEMKHYLNAGIAVSKNSLKLIALQHAVLINNDKVIKGLLRNEVPFNSEKEIIDFCDWLFTCGNNRVTRLGRSHCIGYLADYLPEVRVSQAFKELWDVLQEKWSFNKDFDYKRTAIESLGQLFPRLTEVQQTELVKMLWSFVLTEPPLVKRQIAESLSNIRSWSGYPSKEASLLLNDVIHYLDINSTQSMEYSLLVRLLIDISEYVDAKEQRATAGFLEKKWNDGYSDAISLFLNDHLIRYTETRNREKAIQTAMSQVEREIHSDSEILVKMKGYDWGAILVYFIPFVEDTSLLQEAQSLLARYIEASNVSNDKRSKVLNGLYFLLRKEQNLQIGFNELQETCLRCLRQDSTWQTNNKSDFFAEGHNLLAGLFRLLSQLEVDVEFAKDIIHRLLSSTLSYTKDELSSILVAATDWARTWNDNPMIYMPIISRLYMECRNQDEWVRAAAVHGLIEVAQDRMDDSAWHYVSNALDIALRDQFRIVRYNLAYSIQNLLELNTHLEKQRGLKLRAIIETLQSDISHLVREAAFRRKKVSR